MVFAPARLRRWSPGFSRIRRSRHYALSRQTSHRLKPGLPVIHIQTYFLNVHTPGLLGVSGWSQFFILYHSNPPPAYPTRGRRRRWAIQ